jgi:hypothetical protein
MKNNTINYKVIKIKTYHYICNCILLIYIIIVIKNINSKFKIEDIININLDDPEKDNLEKDNIKNKLLWLNEYFMDKIFTNKIEDNNSDILNDAPIKIENEDVNIDYSIYIKRNLREINVEFEHDYLNELNNLLKGQYTFTKDNYNTKGGKTHKKCKKIHKKSNKKRIKTHKKTL